LNFCKIIDLFVVKIMNNLVGLSGAALVKTRKDSASWRLLLDLCEPKILQHAI